MKVRRFVFQPDHSDDTLIRAQLETEKHGRVTKWVDRGTCPMEVYKEMRKLLKRLGKVEAMA